MGKDSRDTRRQRQRTVRTRARYPIADDPAANEAHLARTLASLGLYAAHTTGDGNCLFRALADQYYGDHRLHHKVRADICDYLEGHAAYFQNYVLDCEDDDLAANFASHIASMRQNGTYGDDMELTAFSKMTGREIKIVQPGLVYVVADHSPASKKARTSPPIDAAGLEPPAPTSARERRRAAREAKGKAKEVPLDTDTPPDTAQPGFSDHPLWIVYHSWEHFSSARNVAGPHSGLPLTEPRPAADAGSDGSTPSLTDDSDGDTDSAPSADERLLLQSLPPDSQYGTLSAARALIAKHEGSWELALEAAQAELEQEHHVERKRSASPTLPEGSSPRQRIREDSETDSSEEMTEEEVPPDHEGDATVIGKPRSRRNSDRLAPPSSRETRAQMRERLLKQSAAQRVTRSKALEEAIRTLRV